MNRKIIKASIAELDDLTSLFDGYRQFYQMQKDLPQCKNFLKDRLTLHDSLIFMVYKNATAQAFAQIYPSFSSVAMQRIWTLNDLFVGQAYRNEGIARDLIEYVLQNAKREGVFSVKLVTAKTNAVARSLYQSIGFKLNNTFESYSIKPD